MGFPVKELNFADRRFWIHGLSADDRYFQSLHDNMEPEFTRFCRSFVRANYICLDVGANIGMKSLIIASQASDGQVIAIEPGPEVGKLLDLNVERNHGTNIAIEKVAVGEHDDRTVHFHEDSAFGYVGGTGLEVPMTTLAAIATKHSLPRVDFIKMDVEGLEFPILKNSLDFINRNEALVYFEFNAWAQMVHSDVRPREFATWVLDNFSHVYLVNKFGDYGNLLSRIARGDWFRILQHNCFGAHFVDDIVVTNAPWRLDTPEAQCNLANWERNQALAERDAAIMARDAAIAERNAATAERDVAINERARRLAELQAVYDSTSWKVTSGLRAVARLLRPGS